MGNIENAKSHGNNSNAMAKINDNIFCSGGENTYLYLVSVNPVQIIQKLILFEDNFEKITFVHNSGDGFIFSSYQYSIIQFKIIKDEDDNYIKLEKFDSIDCGVYNEAIITTDDGKIFYKTKVENIDDYFNKTNLFLNEYKKLN